MMPQSNEVISVYNRLLAINWQPETLRCEALYGELYVALMSEFLRRSALWAKALSCGTQVRPFFDMAFQIDPIQRADFILVEKLHEHLEPFNRWGTEIKVSEWSLHWAAISNSPEVQHFSLPSPYEPLLVLFEKGGSFTTEHGFVNIAGGMLRLGNWLNYSNRTPFVNLG
jgi:hypothetical protein